jgi:polar amino acid transport system substrate-binding protein
MEEHMNRRWRSLFALAAAVSLIFTACGSPETPAPTPAPTAEPAPVEATMVPTVVPPAEATAQQEGEDDWARIQAAGKILVGTSLDYPPFAYYDTAFKPDGFDVALMTELGKRLGLTVEFNDFAFEGLGAALQLKQVDAAIAAISATPDRQAAVDFTGSYYVSEDGVLAASDSAIQSVATLTEMASRRVGVQRGTIYEAWFTNSLVKTGQMPQEYLFAYLKADDAVRDLQAGKIDLAVMDLLPAQNYVSLGDAKLVGRGLQPQNLAIAVRKGSSRLLEQLNKALGEAQADRTAAGLMTQYLNIEAPQPIPTATPAPVATAAPVATLAPPACLDGMAYVADLNLDDKGMTAPPVLQPGQSFSKGWRISNSGTCVWKPHYYLAFAGGNANGARMGGQPTQIGRTVNPGEVIDIYVNLAAPQTPGTYQGFWQMVNNSDVPFGEKVWAGITVPGAPPPTAAPSPGIQFGVDRAQIKAGECVNFSWNVQNVNAVYFYPDGAPYQNYGVAGQGGTQQCPPQTTTYDLLVVLRNGSNVLKQITIQVTPVQGAPQITQFSSNPQYQVTLGQCLTLYWNVQGAVNRVALLGNGRAMWDGAPASGSYQDCPQGAGAITYQLQAFGPGGSAQAQLAMNVIRPDNPTPIPLPTPIP